MESQKLLPQNAQSLLPSGFKFPKFDTQIEGLKFMDYPYLIMPRIGLPKSNYGLMIKQLKDLREKYNPQIIVNGKNLKDILYGKA